MADEKNKQKPTEGRIVTFFPNESARDRKFRNVEKDSYPAMITQVNDGGETVDLTIFGVGETVFQTRVEQRSESNKTASTWDWPQIEK